MSVPEYDVFLSFRGEDTRYNFTSHLHKELCRQNIKTFIDYELDRGDEVSPALKKAIEESLIYVVILSEHYASSSWCLDELTEILNCKERHGREVIPVFYKVDPSNVRHQRESYADDLAKHHQRFGGKLDAWKMDPSKWMMYFIRWIHQMLGIRERVMQDDYQRFVDKVDKWKASLTQVARLSGWDSEAIRPESTLVTEIVKDIVKKLNRCASSDYEGMTGIDNHIEKIQSLLLLESPTVRIIGIWGMGGIGKTTIANAIFEKLATHFSSKSIIRDVKKEIERVGLFHVKKEYLSQLLNESITSSESNSYDQRLKRTKGLIVFDDVKDADQLQDLIGTHHKFGEGSRIIVTSRDKQVLENANADEIYQVREMDKQDSLQLFCLFAFKQNHPKESFVSLTEKVLNYAKGLPLALKVLGSLLYGKANEVWESQLEKLEKLPDDKIFSVLKLSYDGLDKEQKDIFLDIACFHIWGWEKDVALTLDSCGFSACKGMDDLEDRGLISISEGRVRMHDLIQEMGHEIVRRECEDDPGKRSRLWKTSDVYDVLSNNKGTDAIKRIFVPMDEIDEEVQLHADTFKKMHNLRMIWFYSDGDPDVTLNVTFHGVLSFPNNLKFLQWQYDFPQRSLPQDFSPKNLVTLNLYYSNLEQLWEGDQALLNLKRLNLRNSKKLTRLPDLSLCPNIEEVWLPGCISLTEVNSSSFLNNLYILDVKGCTELKSINIPSNILSRPSGLLALTGCYKLETLIISSRTVHVVQFTHFYRYYKFERMKFCGQIEIEMNDEGDYENDEGDYENDKGDYRFQESFHNTFQLVRNSITDFYWLDLSNCESLTCLPAELLNLKFLTRLCLGGCLKLEELPEIKGTMENLKALTLDETAIKELPSSLHLLVGLEELSLQGCTKLKTIPSSIGNLNKLLKLNLRYCESLETITSSILKLKLTKLCFPGSAIPDWFPHCCRGHSISIRSDDLYLYGGTGNKLIGFALCVVLGPDFPYELFQDFFDVCIVFRYELKFESNGQIHLHPNNLEVEYYWQDKDRRFGQDQTFLWKYELDLARIGNGLIDAHTIITFQILDKDRRRLSFPTTMTVKECGICPLYAKESNE